MFHGVKSIVVRDVDRAEANALLLEQSRLGARADEIKERLLYLEALAREPYTKPHVGPDVEDDGA